ncbi:MAG: sulfur oxidation c-type cytochrome SoxX, partial [Burkholderiaceae bacterium]|nr:sulfur oxidation c-type cytochrome SoxX [Burkholderiaceae bacterium]
MKKMNSKFRTGLAAATFALLVVGCASAPSVADLSALTQKIVKASFRDEGIVKASILNTDETNQACSEADASGKPLDEKTAKRIEEINMKAIKWPSDGKFIGDWKEGEKIAQNGRGLTFTDDEKTV